MAKTTALYDTIGGKAALLVVVDEFYQRVLADPLLSPMFVHTDMAKQRAHQVAFLSVALGGPSEYQGRDMQQAHAGLDISTQHFLAVVGHLQTTLSWAGVGPVEIDKVIDAAAGLQDDIVSA
ncbi:MAG: hemoglobin [Hyphomicrobiaceae bacterium]|jgi:hemoglobin